MLTNLMANSWGTWIFMGVLILLFIGMYVMSYQKRKKEAEKAKEKMDSIKPGTKIKTIGLIEGEVVEVYENDLLIKSGDSVIKIDKRAIYQIEPEVLTEEDFIKTEENAEQPAEQVQEVENEEKVEEIVE